MIRLFYIFWIMIRYRIFFPPKNKAAQMRYGKRLSQALQKLGPSFIKFGQALSTRSDILGEPITEALTTLQDRLPPSPSKKIIRSIEHYFKKPIDQIFQSFNPEAQAAASIAQVHQAELFDGTKIAVKILRPNIQKAFKKDIRLFHRLAKIISFLFPSTRRLRLSKVVKTYEQTLKFELDLRNEAASANALQNAFKNDPNYNIPKIYWDYTGPNLMVSQWIEGTPLNQIKKGDKRLPSILNAATKAFFHQVFNLGFFHADPHPGNFIIDKNGKLWVLDFGIMGQISYEERLYLADILVGFLTRNYALVAQAHLNAGYLPNQKRLGEFTLACRAIAEPILNKPLSEISFGTLLKQLFSVSRDFEMETQPQLLLLQKSLLTSEGMCKKLYPEINLWHIAEPLIKDWVRKHQGPEAKLARFLKKCYHLILTSSQKEKEKPYAKSI